MPSSPPGAGNFNASSALLYPDVVPRADLSPGRPDRSTAIRGAAAVAQAASLGASPAAEVLPVLVNGTVGVVITRHGRPYATMAFTIRDDKGVEIDSIGAPNASRD